jgi:predicted Fe-Mo cluster-binding NifX family protein
MKIAVATVEKNENSEISQRAGRAPYYLIFDENGKVLETISNPFSVGGGGAGFGVAKMLADKDVDIVVAGRFGPNMSEALKSRGVNYQEKTDNAKNAISEVVK